MMPNQNEQQAPHLNGAQPQPSLTPNHTGAPIGGTSSATKQRKITDMLLPPMSKVIALHDSVQQQQNQNKYDS